MSDPRPESCDICGASPVEQVLYPVAVHFKGSGFYSTDYGRGGRKRDGAGKDGDAPTKSSDSSGGDKPSEPKKKAAEPS